MFSYRLLVAGLFATVLPVLAAETPSCAALKDVHLATLMVSQSELVPAGPDAANPMAPAAPRRNLPEYCVVRGELEGRTGARGAHYGIGFELRLPTKWNHRFLYQGGGGLDGFVAPAVGQISVGNSSAASALERGYAVVSTDSGHHAQNMGDASFGFDQQARLNYAYAAIGTLTTAVLEVVQAYYHQPAAHSYFMGCSNGGREALMAAERFPTLGGERWYRTGDLAFEDAAGSFHHLGRIDNQVKILGNRVELEEVEAHLRIFLGIDMVAALAWPITDGRASAVVAFHCAPGVTRDNIREEMKKRVPDYMIPKRVYYLEALPLGATGKIDRKALTRMLDENLV